jgi:hypothetical protein
LEIFVKGDKEYRMSNWKCDHCKHDNDKDAKNCKRCNSHHSHKEDKHDDHKHDMHKKRKKVYTSGVIANTDREDNQAAQDLYVSVTNFSEHPVTVKVEVFNWGNPNVSAGLAGSPMPGMPMPMGAKRVTVMPDERVKIPGCKTQHFHADLTMDGNPNDVLSFEVRVTVISKGHEGKVVFNAVSYSLQELLEEQDPGDIHIDEEVLGEEGEEEEATPPRTEALVVFKDFVLLEDDKDDKNCCL